MLDYLSISDGIFVKVLPHLRCVVVFISIPSEIYGSVGTKENLTSDFHIIGQLMETHPEYSSKFCDSDNLIFSSKKYCP